MGRVLIVIGLRGKKTGYDVGLNFVMAANTYKKEMQAKGHTVKKINAKKVMRKTQKTYKERRKIAKTKQTKKIVKSINAESAMHELKNQMKDAYGNNGINTFAYFGHSHPDGLSVFFGAGNKVTVGDKRWITADTLKDVKFNSGASAYLYGCNAGYGSNSVAQKIANGKKITVYAYTDYSLFTDDKNLASGKREIIPKDYSKTFSKNTSLCMVAKGGLKKFSPK